ncbi:MAG: DNA gyrase subunit B [Clostridia bacterium]|nr:DNA gyrase subunit B [Clostridia bacterium]MBQ8429939.1 DNA gyrase subunit B [Clostridia bacterium]
MAGKKDLTQNNEYSAKNLEVLEGLDAVRMRPGMYIGSTGIKGLHHILWEIVDNAIDEAANGHANRVKVTLHADGSASVEDNGRGIPTDIHPKEKVSGVQLVFTKLHAGGKFGQGNYEYSGGLHGVGASVTNALSEWLTVEVCRNKRVYKMSFHSKYNARKKKVESGLPDGPLEDTGISTNRKGTYVRFKPDATVFSETEFDLDTVEERLNQLAFLNRGVEITIMDERITMAEARRSRMLFGDDTEENTEEGEDAEAVAEENEEPTLFDFADNGQQSLFGEVDELALESEPYRAVFKYDGGISDYVKNLNEGKRKLYAQPIYYKAVKNDIQVEFAIQHTDDYRTEGLVSFVNNIPTPEGGYHEIGFKSGLARVLNEYARNNGFLKDKDQNFQGEDFREGMTAVLSIKMANVQFEGQTKTKLGNTEARPPVEATVIEGLNALQNVRGYKKTMEEIIKKAQGAAKSRIAAKTAKDNARAKNSIDGLTLVGKLAACSGKKPELNEMFIVEGDSAGGTAKQGRDRRFQSILPLRGKPLNVEKKKLSQILENEEIRTMISAIGAGIDPDFKEDKINYHKVIILSDADQDGMHIRCILLTFFFRYMRPLVNAGHVYIGMPPLYKVYKGDKVEYAYDDKELNEKIEKIGKGYQLQRYKGLGEMSSDQLWETTMNPATRNLIQVTVEDAAKAERMITTLMGDKVEGRKEFLAKYANFNKRDTFMERIEKTDKKEVGNGEK